MNKVLAVALLDLRRLAFGLLSAALVGGLVPALASGMGTTIEIAHLMAFAFVVVGLASGASLGGDFAEGRGSFFFARPLSTAALIAGRFVALLAMAAATFVAVMSSNWLSTSDRSAWSPRILERSHAEVLMTSWSLALFCSLAIAAQGRAEGGVRSVRDMARIVLRLTLVLSGVLAVFGLFADLTLRAYLSPAPVRLFSGSWIAAAFVASCVGIVAGRTERLRIARFQNSVMLAHLGLTASVVLAAWTYVLHPGPEAIEAVVGADSSPDGRFAYVTTRVDRGDPMVFRPIFILDLTTGETRHLNADRFQGPWPSRDGGTLAWSEATPFFFRPIWRLVGGGSSYRMASSGGNAEPFDLPKRMAGKAMGTEYFENSVDFVLPSSDGDVLAVLGKRHFTFVSRSRGEQPDIELGPGSPSVRAMAFVASGALRAAVVRNASPEPLLEFVEIDPRSNKVTSLASMGAGPQLQVHFDREAGRALVRRSGARMARGTLSLIRLDQGLGSAQASELLPESDIPQAIFLGDGRIVSRVGGRNQGALKVFSPLGAPVLDLALGDGVSFLAGEMFPGIVAVQNVSPAAQELLLVDCATGKTIRRIAGMRSSLSSQSSGWWPPPPLPGTKGARLLQSTDSKLHELKTPSAEPRLLLPLPKD